MRAKSHAEVLLRILGPVVLARDAQHDVRSDVVMVCLKWGILTCLVSNPILVRSPAMTDVREIGVVQHQLSKLQSSLQTQPSKQQVMNHNARDYQKESTAMKGTSSPPNISTSVMGKRNPDRKNHRQITSVPSTKAPPSHLPHIQLPR